MTLFFIKRSRLGPTIRNPDYLSEFHIFVRFSNGQNKMAAKTRWPNILASLNRFVGNKIFVITVFIKRSRLATIRDKSGFRMVQYSNAWYQAKWTIRIPD